MIVPDGQGGEDWYFYHLDGLGSVAALSKYDSGQGYAGIVERYVYDVFGAVNVCDGSGTPRAESACGNPYMFTGRRYDVETQTPDQSGLYYYRARMYAPDLGRFLQPDPIVYDDGMNMYSYVGNNPTSFVDPFGLCKGDRGFFRKLWDGDYFGTQYGASSTDIWAARAPAALPVAAHLDENDRAGDRGGDHQQHGYEADIWQENFVAVQPLDRVAERATTFV